MPLLAVAWPCVVPKAALLPPYPRRNSPRRSGVWPPTSANSSGYALRTLEKGSGPGADQVTNSGVHGAIFRCGGHTSRQVKTNVIRIAVSVYSDLLPSTAPDPERACSFSPHSRDSCIESTCHISYGIALLGAQGGAVPPVPPEKQTPQIWRLAADNRKQFRVSSALLRNALPGAKNSSIEKEIFDLSMFSK